MAQNDFVKTFDLEDLTESFWKKKWCFGMLHIHHHGPDRDF